MNDIASVKDPAWGSGSRAREHDLPKGAATGKPVAGLVSVILIFHNEGPYLEEAIRSVREQTYGSWELLLVDDGSTDGSSLAARRAVSGEPGRLRYLAHPGNANRGMSASRNLGLACARGEYVAFLDGDDVFLPERLERHVAILREFPAVAMVQSDHIRWRSWGPDTAGRGRDRVRPFFTVGDQVLWPPLGLERILAVPYLTAGICNITVRREIARAAGGFVDAFASLYEDQAFVARVSLGWPVYVLQAYLARYRYHPGSATRRIADSGAAGSEALDRYSLAYLDWLIGLLRQPRGIDTSRLLALARARRAAQEPSRARRLRSNLSTAGKTLMRTLLPSAWYSALLDLDYARGAMGGRRAYAELAEELTARAWDRARMPRSRS